MKSMIIVLATLLGLATFSCSATEQGYITLTGSELQHVKLSTERDPYVLMSEKHIQIFSILGLQSSKMSGNKELKACMQAVQSSQRIVKQSTLLAASEQALFFLAETAEKKRDLADMMRDIVGLSKNLVAFDVQCDAKTQRTLIVAQGLDNVWMTQAADRAPVPPVAELPSHTVLAQKARPAKDLIFSGRLNINKILADAIVPLGTKADPVVVIGDVTFNECVQFEKATISGTHHLGAVQVTGPFPDDMPSAAGAFSRGLRFVFDPLPDQAFYIKMIMLAPQDDDSVSAFKSLTAIILPAASTFEVIENFSQGPSNFAAVNFPLGGNSVDILFHFTTDLKNPLFVYKVVAPGLKSVTDITGPNLLP